jgi:hypothetical protein
MSADQPDYQTSSVGIQRLRRALAGDDGHMTHAEALAQLPAYCEAERLGLPVAQHYPDLTAHLDVCPSCAQEYVALQEALSWQDDNPLPLPAPAPQPDLWFLQPRAERLRQAVTTMTQALVRTLLPSAQQRRLKYQLDPFFDRVAELGGQFRLTPAQAPQPLALGESEPSPSRDLLIATYLAAEALGRTAPTTAWAVQPLEQTTLTLIRQECARAAQTVGLNPSQARDFVERFTALVLQDARSLARSAPVEGIEA